MALYLWIAILWGSAGKGEVAQLAFRPGGFHLVAVPGYQNRRQFIAG